MKFSPWPFIQNCIIMLCFTALALAFKMWWMVFIGLLFMLIMPNRNYAEPTDEIMKQIMDSVEEAEHNKPPNKD